jgi:hypothetical protein
VAGRGPRRQARALATTSISRNVAYSPEHKLRLIHISSNQPSSHPQEQTFLQVLDWVLGQLGPQRCSLAGLQCQNLYVNPFTIFHDILSLPHLSWVIHRDCELLHKSSISTMQWLRNWRDRMPTQSRALKPCLGACSRRRRNSRGSEHLSPTLFSCQLTLTYVARISQHTEQGALTKVPYAGWTIGRGR